MQAQIRINRSQLLLLDCQIQRINTQVATAGLTNPADLVIENRINSLYKMKKAFRNTLIILAAFILILIGMLIAVIQGWKKYSDLPDTMMMIDFPGLLLAILGVSILIFAGIGITFGFAYAWSLKRPELGSQIVRLAMTVSILIILVLGGLASGVIVLRTLQTIGFV